MPRIKLLLVYFSFNVLVLKITHPFVEIRVRIHRSEYGRCECCGVDEKKGPKRKYRTKPD